MRVKKEDIIAGLTAYIENEVIPKIGDDRAMRIILSTGVSLFKQKNFSDKVFKNNMLCLALDYGKDDTYDISAIFSAASSSVAKHGYFPISIPAVPFISPSEKELKFTIDDIESLKSYIEGNKS